jgi:hypothetical protein
VTAVQEDDLAAFAPRFFDAPLGILADNNRNFISQLKCCNSMQLSFRQKKQRRVLSESYEGWQLKKEFPGHGVFKGSVGPLLELNGMGGKLGYMIRYDDGDTETLTHQQVAKLLVRPEKAEAKYSKRETAPIKRFEAVPASGDCASWQCGKCTFLNAPSRKACQMCTGPKVKKCVQALAEQASPAMSSSGNGVDLSEKARGLPKAKGTAYPGELIPIVAPPKATNSVAPLASRKHCTRSPSPVDRDSPTSNLWLCEDGE